MNCSHCGNQQVETGVVIGKASETGFIGPIYTKGFSTHVAQMLCDMCPQCGEILRLYLDQTPTGPRWYKLR